MALRKSDYDVLLKEDYHGPISDLLENSAALVGRMERYTEPTGGRYFYQPLRTGRATSIGARNDGESETLPTAGRVGYGNVTFPAKSLYATVRITGFVLRSSKKDNLAYARAQVRDMEDTAKDMKKDVNRILFGAGDAGLAYIAATATASAGGTGQFQVNSNLFPTKPTKYFYVGQKLDFITRSTGAITTGFNGVEVTSVDSASLITISGTSASAAAGPTTITDVVRDDNVGAIAAGGSNEIKEPYGLHAAINVSNPSAVWGTGGSATIAANYGGQSRAVAPYNVVWKGNRLANAGVLRPFSVNLVQSGIDEAEEVGGGEISLLQTNYKIFRVYGSMLATAKQYEGSVMKLDGGWDALSVGGIPMVKDVDSPDYRIYCMDESTFMLGVIDDWNWIDEGNGVLGRLPGQDQYEAVMVRDLQLINVAPNKNTIIEDIAHS